MKINLYLSLASTVFCLCLSSCTDSYYGNGGGYNSGGYNSGYNGGYNDPYEYDRYDERRERKQLEKERDRLEDERRRLEDERRRREQDATRRPVAPPVYSQPKREERCPSGFSPSERKCSTEERRKGCKDMRLPGGLGCVNR